MWRQLRRTVFSSEQLRKLEQLFDETHYPDTSQREAVSAATHLGDDRIQVIQVNLINTRECVT